MLNWANILSKGTRDPYFSPTNQVAPPQKQLFAMSSVPEKSVVILPKTQLTFTAMKNTPDVASATVSIYNPTPNPVLYKIKGNKGICPLMNLSPSLNLTILLVLQKRC